MTLAGTLELIDRAGCAVRSWSSAISIPILRYGLDRFLRDAEALGVAGLLLTDLPAGSDPGVESAVHAEPAGPDPPDRADHPPGAPGRRRVGCAGLRLPGGAPGRHRRQCARSPTTSRARSAECGRRPGCRSRSGSGSPRRSRRASVARLADGVVVGSALVDILGRDGVERRAALPRGLCGLRLDSGRAPRMKIDTSRVLSRYAQVLAVGGGLVTAAGRGAGPALDRAADRRHRC